MPSIISSPRGHRAVQKLTINGRTFSANSTGYIPETESTMPSTNGDALFTFISNSTGNYLAINQTGTTWVYVNTTSVAPS